MKLHLQITSGRGPEECGWVVARLIPRFFQDAAQKGLTITEIEVIPGIPSTIRSAVFEITGESAETFARSWIGTILWIGKSPFDPHHKRKNWYVGIERIALDTGENQNLKDIEIQTMRATGPGGQHVNKTSSAVRAIHRPTGLAAVAQDGRSQHQNRKLALARLQLLLNKRNALKEEGKKKHKWDLHNQLERGNPVRTFEGADFQERLR